METAAVRGQLLVAIVLVVAAAPPMAGTDTAASGEEGHPLARERVLVTGTIRDVIELEGEGDFASEVVHSCYAQGPWWSWEGGSSVDGACSRFGLLVLDDVRAITPAACPVARSVLLHFYGSPGWRARPRVLGRRESISFGCLANGPLFDPAWRSGARVYAMVYAPGQLPHVRCGRLVRPFPPGCHREPPLPGEESGTDPERPQEVPQGPSPDAREEGEDGHAYIVWKSRVCYPCTRYEAEIFRLEQWCALQPGVILVRPPR